MFGLDPVWVVAVVVIGLLSEVAILWASSALADAPDQGLGKLLAISAGVFAACFAAVVGIAFWQGVLFDPLAENLRSSAYLAVVFAILACAVLPSATYPLVMPLTPKRGVWLGIFQILLRLFLYILLAALVMVGLAVFQIYRGPGDSRTQDLHNRRPAVVARL